MSNPFSGLVNSTLKETYHNMIDSLLEDDAATVSCRLIYQGGKFEDCPDCTSPHPIGNLGGNPYFGGNTGIFPTTSNCVTCNGSQKIPVETTEDIKMIVIMDFRRFVYFGAQHPAAMAQTFSDISLLPKLKNCSSIILNTENESYNRYRFVRDGEPEPVGLGNPKHIYTFWKKSG